MTSKSSVWKGRGKVVTFGTSLTVQRLIHHASTSGDTGSISGQGTKIPQAKQCSKKKIEWKYKVLPAKKEKNAKMDNHQFLHSTEAK